MADVPPLKVVQLHDGRPSLNDIPARLRLLADQIEAGEHEATGALVLLPRKGDYPRVFGFGDVEGANDPIIQLALAHHWFLTKLVVRA